MNGYNGPVTQCYHNAEDVRPLPLTSEVLRLFKRDIMHLKEKIKTSDLTLREQAFHRAAKKIDVPNYITHSKSIYSTGASSTS